MFGTADLNEQASHIFTYYFAYLIYHMLFKVRNFINTKYFLILISKLEYCGVTGKASKLIQSYFIHSFICIRVVTSCNNGLVQIYTSRVQSNF